MIADHLKELAKQLQSGAIPAADAGKLIEAHAELVWTMEKRSIEIEKCARATVLNGIGLMTSLAELENAIPRPPRPVDGTPETTP
jgi:hypothetical protein